MEVGQVGKFCRPGWWFAKASKIGSYMTEQGKRRGFKQQQGSGIEVFSSSYTLDRFIIWMEV